MPICENRIKLEEDPNDYEYFSINRKVVQSVYSSINGSQLSVPVGLLRRLMNTGESCHEICNCKSKLIEQLYNSFDFDIFNILKLVVHLIGMCPQLFMIFYSFPHSASAMWPKLQRRSATIRALIISFCLLAAVDLAHATLSNSTTSVPQLLPTPRVAQNVTTPASNAAKEKKYIDDDFMKVSPW